jgi:hypothetical protein
VEQSNDGRPGLDLGAERGKSVAKRAMSGRPIRTDTANIAAVASLRTIGCTKYTKVFPLHR